MKYEDSTACNKSSLIYETVEDLKSYSEGVFVTLNSLSKDEFIFDSQLEVLIHWLKEFSYGRNYKRDENRLRVVGAFEIGTVNQGLHIHLVIMYNNDTNRSLVEIESFVRRKWYALVGAKLKAHKDGSLVNVQSVGCVQGRIGYITKTYSHDPKQFNLRYF